MSLNYELIAEDRYFDLNLIKKRLNEFHASLLTIPTPDGTYGSKPGESAELFSEPIKLYSIIKLLHF